MCRSAASIQPVAVRSAAAATASANATGTAMTGTRRSSDSAVAIASIRSATTFRAACGASAGSASSSASRSASKARSAPSASLSSSVEHCADVLPPNPRPRAETSTRRAFSIASRTMPRRCCGGPARARSRTNAASALNTAASAVRNGASGRRRPMPNARSNPHSPPPTVNAAISVAAAEEEGSSAPSTISVASAVRLPALPAVSPHTRVRIATKHHTSAKAPDDHR